MSQIFFCDECKEKLKPEDFKTLRFRGNNIVFSVQIEGMARDYCFPCILKAIKNCKHIEEWKECG